MLRFAPVLLLLFCFSCQKDNTNQQINTGPLLKMYVELSSAPADTIYKITFTYDDRNRISMRVKETRVFSLVPYPDAINDRLDTTLFYYSGDKELPYHLSDVYYDFSLAPIGQKNTYFTYDADGFLVNDSSYAIFYGDYEKKVSKYKYAGNIINTENFIDMNGAQTKDSLKTKLELCGDNICTQYDTLYYDPHPDLYYDTRKITMTYDNSVNPFYAVKMRYPTWNLGKNTMGKTTRYLFEDYEYQKNVMLSLDYRSGSHFEGGLTAYNTLYSYTKNSDNTAATVTGLYHETIYQHYANYYGSYSY